MTAMEKQHGASEQTNPLDRMMTKAQVVRRKFKSALPRTMPDHPFSKLEALGRMVELFDRLRGEMEAAGLKKKDVQSGLIFCQPQTKEKKHVDAETWALPDPDTEKIGKFCDRVMSLDKPLFLGLMFLQNDYEAEKEDQKHVVFIVPFMAGPEAVKRLKAARDQRAKGGFKKIAN